MNPKHYCTIEMAKRLLTEVNDGIAEGDPLTVLLKVFLWQKGIET